MFSTTAGILYFNDLIIVFLVFVGLVISFLGAFLFSDVKVIELQELKAQGKKNDDEENHAIENDERDKLQNYIVYVIHPEIK